MEICILFAAIGIAAAIIAFCTGSLPQLTVSRWRSDKAATHEAQHLPKVSVIALASGTEPDTGKFLESVMSQDYPNFEVIMVVDATAESAHIISETYAHYGECLTVTFIPPGSHNLSRRKLALTLGIKAAKGDVVLTTSANAMIPSICWLSAMMSPMADSTKEIVVGYTHPDWAEIKHCSPYIHFESISEACRWLSSDIAGRPWRADGYNLAFRRQLFFDNKGYAKSVNLVAGDDDIFFSEIATRTNTAVMLDPDARITMKWGESTRRIIKETKDSRMFTARFLSRLPRLRAGLASTTCWIAFIALTAAIILSFSNLHTTDNLVYTTGLVMACISAAVLVTLWILQIVIYNKAATLLGESKRLYLVPLYMLWRPIGNSIFRAVHSTDRRLHYTVGR